MTLFCKEKGCDCYGKQLIWIPNEAGEYRLICPTKILTQSDFNLKYVNFESEANKWAMLKT